MKVVETWILTKGLRGIWLNLSLQHIIIIDFESLMVSDEGATAEIMDRQYDVLFFNLQSTFTYNI